MTNRDESKVNPNNISLYIKPADRAIFEWAKTVPRLSLSEVIARALIEYKDKQEKGESDESKNS